VPVKVQFEFETLEEFLDFFEILKGNEPKTKVTISEATISATPEVEEEAEELLTASKPVSKPRKLVPIRCRTCEVDLNSDNWYASMQKKNARQCKSCWNDYLKKRKAEKGKASGKKTKTPTKPKRSTSGWTPEKRAAAAERMKARHAAKEEDKPSKNARQASNDRLRKKLSKKAKKSPKQKKTASTKKKEPTLNLKFESAYAVVNSQIYENSQASVKSVIEALVVSDDEREMMEGIVLKILRGAATHSPNLFGVGEGKNPTLLCFGPPGTSLPPLDQVRAQ
jgi:hypothetical protein